MMRPFDPLLALSALARHRVEYVVIGGFAGDLLGAPLNTNDIDICYERTAGNMERLTAAWWNSGRRCGWPAWTRTSRSS